jgi:pheromone shutdown protein TraB
MVAAFFICSVYMGRASQITLFQDVHNVPRNIFNFKGFLRNRVFKIIMATMVVNIAAPIGIFIA